VETKMVEKNGFEPSSNDVKHPTKGPEKHKSSLWKKIAMCLLL